MELKRITGVLILAGIMAAPVVAIASDTSRGIYVTPKFVYGATQMKGFKYRDTFPFEENFGNKWDNTFGGSLAVGYDLSKKRNLPVRAELEYAAFSKAKAKDEWGSSRLRQSNKIQTMFLNVYYDINAGTKFTPYVGAGVGAGFIRTNGSAPEWGNDIGSKTVTNFAWNIGFGLGYQIKDNIALDVGYRFADLGKVKTNQYTEVPFPWHFETKNLYQHQISAGVRISF